MIGPRREASLSQPPALELDQCLAKTRTEADGKTVAGVDVLTHCQIVGEVARALVLRQPEWLREALFPPGSELVAGSHDVGKVCPTFQKKLYQAVGQFLVGYEGVDPGLEAAWHGHATVSQAATLGVGSFVPEILGRHHGSSPVMGFYTASHESFGGTAWQSRREELLAVLKERLNVDWPQVKDEVQATVLSGLTTVADWIGSGSFFETPTGDWQSVVPLALDHAGFVGPRLRTGLSFQDIFDFAPRPIQSRMVETCTQPGVTVLEAPMGLGKTEAALYAAYQALAAGRATGIYFALPTQLTSNKIHERMDRFLDRILQPDQGSRGSLLVHSRAQLLVNWEMGEDGQPGQSWFSSSKRGLLAPFAVGTVDQALMAVMNVKHGFVRAFGLAGKVVILDEVHAYDSYTGTILDHLVQTLVNLHCTVIILSATLTHSRRAALLGTDGPLDHSEAYPLISARGRQGGVQMIETQQLPSVEVSIRYKADAATALDEALGRAEAGQQVLWVENTVAEAQERYKTLAARAEDCNIVCGLLHSRFLKVDRQNNEQRWVNLYGPSGQTLRTNQGRILVGTQVVEQSLDIDADFLVTKLAPTDMLLQRMGRLWRHRDNDATRPSEATREVWILAPDLTEALTHPEVSLGPSGVVYSPYVLLRTLEVWQDRAAVSIPKQIRDLLESTYQKRAETGVFARFQQELEVRKQKLRGLALVGLSQGGVTLPERAATRYSDIDTVEVLLLRRYHRRGPETAVTFTDGSELTLPDRPWAKDRPQWRQAAVALLLNTVTVSQATAPPALPETVLGWLKPYVYLEDSFRVALVREDGSVTPFQEGAADLGLVTYDSEIGYQTPVKESPWKTR